MKKIGFLLLSFLSIQTGQGTEDLESVSVGQSRWSAHPMIGDLKWCQDMIARQEIEIHFLEKKREAYDEKRREDFLEKQASFAREEERKETTCIMIIELATIIEKLKRQETKEVHIRLEDLMRRIGR